MKFPEILVFRAAQLIWLYLVVQLPKGVSASLCFILAAGPMCFGTAFVIALFYWVWNWKLCETLSRYTSWANYSIIQDSISSWCDLFHPQYFSQHLPSINLSSYISRWLCPDTESVDDKQCVRSPGTHALRESSVALLFWNINLHIEI